MLTTRCIEVTKVMTTVMAIRQDRELHGCARPLLEAGQILLNEQAAICGRGITNR
jgi:hypothetical protein